MKKANKFIALLLTIAMLLTIVPAQAFAQDSGVSAPGEIITLPEDYVNGTRVDESGKKLSNISAEDLELRDANVKHFRCEDGTYVAASYPMPVHYEENGQWKDIDNSMVFRESATVQAFSMEESAAPQNTGSYVNTSSDISVSLPETLSKTTGMTLDFGGNPISFGLLCPNASQGQVITDESIIAPTAYSALSEEAVKETNYEDYLTLSHLTSGVKYENVYPNTDVEYIVSPVGMKENIIIKSRQDSYSYTYHIAADGLTLTLNADKSVTALNAEGNPVYTIEAPYLFDADGIESYDVAAALNASGDGYDLVYTPDVQWMNSNDRVFPVTLDPSIIVETKKSDILDTYVSSSEPTANCSSRSYFTVGNNKLGTDRAYLKFNVPDLPHCSMINYASLNLAVRDYDGAASGSIYACLYETGTAGSGQTANTQTMTWNTQPTQWLSGVVIDYTPMEANKNIYTWNITSLVKKWYEDGSNTGVAIKSSNESFVRKVGFYSSNASNQNVYPTVIVQYTNNIGLEDYWTYHSIDNGRSGVSSINDYNGSLVHIHQDIAMNGSRMPINVSHVYNMDKNEEDYYNGGYMSTGVGWRLNIRERIVELDQNKALYQPLINQGYTHKYFDADGTVKFFKTKNGVWVYEYDDSLKLEIIGGTTASKRYAMSDDAGNEKYFDYNGRLRGCKDSNGNEQVITYDANGKLSKITDPVGRQVTFGYTGILLTSITDPSGRVTKYTYSTSNNKSYLTKITYPDGKFTSFTYDADDNLIKITGIDGAKSTFEYKGVTAVSDKTNFRMKKAQFFGTAGTLQNQFAYTYQPYATTITDNFNKSETMMFDNAGRTVVVKDQDNRAFYGKYNDSGNKNNTLKYQSNMQQSIINFARNHSAERDGADWYWNAIGGASGSQSVVTTEHRYGNKAFKVTSSTQTGRITYRQDLTLPMNKTYTFSAYIKTGNITTSGGGAFLAFVYQDAVTQQYNAVMGEMVEETEGWERYSVTCTLGADKTANAGLMMGLLNAEGSVYFDGIQVETGTVANHYNLIENPGMTAASNNVPSYWTAEGCDASDIYYLNYGNPGSPGGSVKIIGSPDKNQKLYQDVEVNGNAGDTLIVGAWAKHNSVMRTGDSQDKSCAIVVCVEYKEPVDSSGNHLVYDEFYFDSLSSDWQYLTGHVTALGAYDTVSVFLRYRNNMNSVVFDDVQLHVDNYGTKYEYDDKGRIVSQKDSAGQEYKYTYTGPDITKIEFKKDGVTQTTQTYEYDSKHNVTKATSDAGVITQYTYGENGANTYGNATKVAVKNPDGTLQTSSTCQYTGDYNYMTKVFDARNKCVEYNYNTAKGTLNWVKDPDGNVTSYTYDPNTDVLLSTSGKSTNTGVNQTVTNSYAYSNDMLQSITHNGFSYNFTYDQFGRALSTKVGTQTLNTNAYNANGTLNKTTYGNGDYVEPVYDSLDQVVAKKYNGTTRYQWQYGTNGLVGEHTDHVNGIKYHYEYDYADRLYRVYGSDGYKQRNIYDAKGNIYNTLYTFANNSYIKKFSNNYVYADDNRLTQVHFNQSGVNLNRTYDGLGRVTQKNYSLWDGAPFFTTGYSYLAGAGGNTTGIVSSVTNKGETISYTYDNRGNITAINEGGVQKARYAYDELNQLIREDNAYLNKSVAYTYDAGGNLTAKKEYAYTTGTLGAVTKTTAYTYGDASWKDKLTAYDGKAITYDQIGNPLTYGGNTFAWTGRQLDSISGNGNTIDYKYNANGIRTEKTVNGVTTKYFIEGDRIVLEKAGNEERAFWYDGNGNAAAFVIYDAAGMHPYYYFRNGQGDIIGLFDGNGTIVARYSYDSWGNLLSIKDGSGSDKTNDTTFVGYKNPLRYRGYYYDSETKLYYLQSRYYNPEWGRFLNADGIIGANGDLTSNNLFAYCSNNPVMFADPSGYLVEALEYNNETIAFVGYSGSVTVMWDSYGTISFQTSGGIIGGSDVGFLSSGGAYIRYHAYDKVEDVPNDLFILSGSFYIGGVGAISENVKSDDIVGYAYSLSSPKFSALGPVSYSMSRPKTKSQYTIKRPYNNPNPFNCDHSFTSPHYRCDLPQSMVEIRCVYCGYSVCYPVTREDIWKMKHN